MIKHIIAGISTLLALVACVYMYNSDKEVNKMDTIASLIEKSRIEVKLSDKKELKQEIAKEESTKTVKKQQNNEMDDKLKALKDKAGNIAAFNVSPLYKKNCSSCHGSIGEGIIGPRLIGRSKEFILKNLKDFKSGKRKNYVMYGLLGNLNDDQLVKLATEISSFKEKLDAVKQ
ncbi:MAG: hypothetical protein R3331_04595 [Sulfurospirillaceae bacterium]|nr:hypothetical protein [Sulfurospirillaceae bacterium]